MTLFGIVVVQTSCGHLLHFSMNYTISSLSPLTIPEEPHGGTRQSPHPWWPCSSLLFFRRSLALALAALLPSFITPHSSTACPPRLAPKSRTANASPNLSNFLHISSTVWPSFKTLLEPTKLLSTLLVSRLCARSLLLLPHWESIVQQASDALPLFSSTQPSHPSSSSSSSHAANCTIAAPCPPNSW